MYRQFGMPGGFTPLPYMGLFGGQYGLPFGGHNQSPYGGQYGFPFGGYGQLPYGGQYGFPFGGYGQQPYWGQYGFPYQYQYPQYSQQSAQEQEDA